MAASEPLTKVSVVPFTPELLPSVAAFSNAYWKRPTSNAYFRWRYLEPMAFSRMFVAVRGEECVGTLFALAKTYRLGGTRIPCLEVFDWHALSDLRGAGVGIRLMRAMMRQPERIFAVGGTDDVHGALPLMGWEELAVGQAYELLIGTDLIAERLQRTRKLPAALTRALLAPVPRAVFGPRRVPRPAGAEVRVVEQVGTELRELYDGATGAGLVQEPTPQVLSWILRGQWSGRWRFLQFWLANRLRGWAMTRVHVSNHGKVGAILELYAPGADPELYRWMVSETAFSLLEDRPRRLVARASDPMLQRALAAVGFRHAGVDATVRTWPKFGAERPANTAFTFLHSDGPILPYIIEPQTGVS
jgi:hypothetical protein